MMHQHVKMTELDQILRDSPADAVRGLANRSAGSISDMPGAVCR